MGSEVYKFQTKTFDTPVYSLTHPTISCTLLNMFAVTTTKRTTTGTTTTTSRTTTSKSTGIWHNKYVQQIYIG